MGDMRIPRRGAPCNIMRRFREITCPNWKQSYLTLVGTHPRDQSHRLSKDTWRGQVPQAVRLLGAVRQPGRYVTRWGLLTIGSKLEILWEKFLRLNPQFATTLLKTRNKFCKRSYFRAFLDRTSW